jgi:hypothetical protein
MSYGSESQGTGGMQAEWSGGYLGPSGPSLPATQTLTTWPHPTLMQTYPCSENAHYFACKHEPKCECGLTERIVELALDEGI